MSRLLRLKKEFLTTSLLTRCIISFPYHIARRQASSLPERSSSLFDAVYVINLDRRPDRWKFISKQLQRAGFSEEDYKRFSAVEGNTIDARKAHACGILSLLGFLRLQAKESQHIWGMDLNNGAVGCALSHVMLWAVIAARRLRCVLIVEDDSLFPVNFHQLYKERMRRVPHDWELVYVSGLDTAGQTPLLRIAEGVSRVPQMHRTTNCYVITHQGARRLLDLCLPMTYQLDTMMTLHVGADINSAAGGEEVAHVVMPVCYTMQPPLVVQATRMGSDIQSSNGRDEKEEERARFRAAGWNINDIDT
ncbi:Glycosyl transferase [Trypanosoma melophagium]|uniref:Glycosyl transferase n=1 Tax=Trypanosoma melophagium TaxID=715481 RepID=UPI00351A00F9|nr:Glycosyl transferase [Trypanosoma melophagium]